jgi:hypothetical protein
MGKKLKIFAFLAVFFAFFLLPGPVKSECYVDAYGNCTGTCDCSKMPLWKCGTCQCDYDENFICAAWYTCHSCVTNTPAPQPTNTPIGGRASPTPRPGGMECSTTEMLPRLLRPQQHPNSCLLLCLHQRPLLHHPPRHKPHQSQVKHF